MKKQQGFTLIELMIVIAIIAILAAIAIPQYNDYTARAQLAEGFTLASGLKTPIAEAYSQDNTDANSCVKPTGAISTGKYVASLEVAASGTGCTITATLNTAGVNNKVSGKKVALAYNKSTGAFTCSTDAPTEVKPKACL
ncbi:pilin [Xanthomonas euvesicatoria]|uniref:Pilin n=1 Tax=Xanthomonas euvesicatoria TaxID=456327 RepID=A0AAX4FI43_XANEU|nr:pilin [Xanthomonas euvesicatoria]WOP47155.1 pilin [Xanthomonas euvesicatoria]WOP53430.1 pilin [Xanthomonas euvesicatoria]WOP55662.1 pilin [Xanthomonas euvesicatoria]